MSDVFDDLDLEMLGGDFEDPFENEPVAVSYTHLDVYKRQIQCERLAHGHRGDHVRGHARDVRDVYKRQRRRRIH